MNYIKMLLVLPVILAIMTLLTPAEAMAGKRIGMLLWSSAGHYAKAQKGILDQLAIEGVTAPAVEFTMENAAGSKAKALEVVRKFAAARMDLIITLGTNATLIATQEIKDVPIVFSTVYDPVESGIANNWNSSGNNTTGASTRIPMSQLMGILKEFAPVKRLAVFYTPGEKNTEAQLKELQGIQSEAQFKVIPVILTDKEEVSQTMSGVVNTVDAIYLTASSIIVSSVPLIVEVANKAKIITVTHLDEIVTNGALLGVAASSYSVGTLAGKKALDVLRGAKPSDIPIEAEKQLDIILNMKTANAGQFQVPPGLMKKVTKVLE